VRVPVQKSNLPAISPAKEPEMVVVCIAIAFVLLVASPALIAFLPQRKMEDEARPSGKLSKALAASPLQRG
jgi:hypothetical protein